MSGSDTQKLLWPIGNFPLVGALLSNFILIIFEQKSWENEQNHNK